jgi:hypothetical protein
MVIAFPCENCGKSFEVDGALAGKKCRCKQCGHIFSIPIPRRPASASKNQQTFGKTEGASRSTAPRSDSPPTAPVSPVRPKPAPAPVHDPYADLVPRSIPTAELYDDEDFLPPRQGKPTPAKKKKRKRRSGGLSLESIPGWVYLMLGLAFLGAIVVACTSTTGVALVGGSAVIVGLIMMLVGGIGLVVVAFQESVACGLLYLFCPFYSLYYLITRWENTKRFFLISCGGWLMVVALGLLLPAVQAARNAADRARRGGQPGGPSAEVETIISSLIDANNELANLLATVNNVPDAERAAPQYNAIRDQIEEFDRRMKALPPLDTFENHRLGFQYNLRLNQSTDRVTEQNKRLTAIPGVFPFLFQSRQQHLASKPTAPVTVASSSGPLTPSPSPNSGSVSIQFPQVDFVDQALVDLKDFNQSRRKRALGRLMHAPLIANRRVEVGEAVAPMLRDPDSWTRSDAAKALAVWGGPESVPDLIQALKDPEFGVRWAVLDTLKALKDPQAAGELATMVAENKDRGKAVEALKAIGPAAETALIPLLTHGDMWVRREACIILKETGTEASVPYLKAIAMRNSGLDSQAAVEALNSMSLRNVDVNPRPATESDVGGSPFKKKGKGIRRQE